MQLDMGDLVGRSCTACLMWETFSQGMYLERVEFGFDQFDGE